LNPSIALLGEQATFRPLLRGNSDCSRGVMLRLDSPAHRVAAWAGIAVIAALAIAAWTMDRRWGAAGLVTAGLSFALQKVIRGDVIALSFTQTTIMEMGQPPDAQDADRGASSYLGGDAPGRALPRRPRRAEAILLEVARERTVDASQLGEEALHEMRRRYVASSTLEVTVAPR
jgi:hypothetical protein